MKTYWNGKPAKVKGVTYIATKMDEPPLHWQNAVVGQKRQGLQITDDQGDTFIIDNEHGDGWKKVTEGFGMWNSGHSSVRNPDDLNFIPNEEIVKEINFLEMQKQQQNFDRWAMEADPKTFERLQRIRENLKKNKTNAPGGKFVSVPGTNEKVFVPNK